jgi:hypothetical protein
MFLKTAVIILTLCATALCLVVLRQQRIDTVHEMSLVHRRLNGHEAALWKLRDRIAGECRPQRIRQRLDESGIEWAPIPTDAPAPRPEPSIAHGDPRQDGLNHGERGGGV